MSRFVPPLMIRLALVLAIALGLVGAGFAHRSAAPLDAQMLAFLEVGGTLDDLCADGQPMAHWGDTGCDACRLITAADVPAVATGLQDAAYATNSLWPNTTALPPHVTPRDHQRSPRAPPVV